MSELLRFKPLSGRWQTIGPEGDWGYVTIANTEATANSWGPDTLSFDLQAEPGKRRPDLFPYTPIEYLVDGHLVWAGFIRSRLDSDTGFAVDCRGWQYHLDDVPYERTYVYASSGEWQDVRDHTGARLARNEYNAEGTVSSETGLMAISWPTDTLLYFGARCGMVLDLGPNSASWAKRVVVSWQASQTTANVVFFARGVTTNDFGTGGDIGQQDLFTVYNNVITATGTDAGTFTTAKRYLEFFMMQLNVANYQTTGDVWFAFPSIKVFTAAAYESGNASVLKADVVIKDARTFAPLLTNSDLLVAAGTYSMPEYVTGGYKTPRQVMEEVNNYENYQLTVAGDDLKTLRYRAKPSAPLFEVGEWSGGATLNDSAVAGDDIYDTAIVEATGPDGQPVYATRTQTGTMLRSPRAMVLDLTSGIAAVDANRLGDLWLAEHAKAPFSGTLNVSGLAIRYVNGGNPIPAHLMLKMVGEKIRFSHVLDPDTGAQGRDGRISAVRYRYADDSLEVAIDDRRDDFATLLARHGDSGAPRPPRKGRRG